MGRGLTVANPVNGDYHVGAVVVVLVLAVVVLAVFGVMVIR